MIQPALFAHHDGHDNRPAMPAWLLDSLDTAGHIDLTAGATRRARPATCNRCHQVVIRALDDDWMALAVDADPEPLTPEGEALARLAGIPTYQLWQLGGRWQIDRRDQWQIRAHPAGTQRGRDILAQHRHDGPQLPRGPSNIAPPPNPAALPDQPPF